MDKINNLVKINEKENKKGEILLLLKNRELQSLIFNSQIEIYRGDAKSSQWNSKGLQKQSNSK